MNKKIEVVLSIFAFIGISSLIIVGLQKKSDQVSSNQDCRDMPTSQLDSERSQGILISDRKVLAVRLNNETNYSVPGGHVDTGESTKRALQRELSEEVGIKADQNDFSYYKTDCQPKNGRLQRVTYYKVAKWQNKVSLASFGDKAKWVDSTFADKKKADTDLKLVTYYLKQEGQID